MNNINIENGFAMVPGDVLKQKLLNGNQLAVYVAIINFANKNNHAFPSYRQIAEAAGVARTTAMNAVKKLEQLKLINKTIRTGSYKNNKTNQYTVLYNGTIRKKTNPPNIGNNEPGCSTGGPIQHPPLLSCMSVQQKDLLEVFENELFILNKASKRKLLELLEENTFEYLVELIKYQAEINTIHWRGFMIAYKAFKDKGINTGIKLRESVDSYRKACITAKSKAKKVVKKAFKAESKNKKRDMKTEIAKLKEKFGCEEVTAAQGYLEKRKGIKDYLAYLKNTLEKGFYKATKPATVGKQLKPLRFNDYNQRETDYDAIESELLGWDDDCNKNAMSDPVVIDEKQLKVTDSAILNKYELFLNVDNLIYADVDFLEKLDLNSIKMACIKFYTNIGAKPSIDYIKQCFA